MPQMAWEDAHRRLGAMGTPMAAANPTVSGVCVCIKCCCFVVALKTWTPPTAEDGWPVFVYSWLLPVKAQPYAFREELEREVRTRRKRKLWRSVRTKTRSANTGTSPQQMQRYWWLSLWPWVFCAVLDPLGSSEWSQRWPLHSCRQGLGEAIMVKSNFPAAPLCWDWDWAGNQIWQRCTFGWREFSVWARISAQVSHFTVSSYKK